MANLYSVSQYQEPSFSEDWAAKNSLPDIDRQLELEVEHEKLIHPDKVDVIAKQEVKKNENIHWKRFKYGYEKWMIFWAIASCVALLFQAITIYSKKDSTGVSLVAYCILLISSFMWGFYATFILAPRNWILFINALLSAAFAIIIIIGIVVYANPVVVTPTVTN